MAEEGDDRQSDTSRKSREVPLRPIQVLIFLLAAAVFLTLGFFPRAWRVIDPILFVVVAVIAVVGLLLRAVRPRAKKEGERSPESRPPIDPT